MSGFSDWINRIQATWHPARYHGHGLHRKYFEGWYYKLVDASKEKMFALIPGVFFDRTGRESHAFIQVLEGHTGRTHYLRFDPKAFWAHRERFEVRVGDSHFDARQVTLNEKDPLSLRAEIKLGSLTPWPVTRASPGAMGWFGLVPFMQCYHGVLSMDHAIRGYIEIGDERVDLDGGRGYMEKDWGRGFPSAWVWMQCNHFDAPKTSLMVSVASVPWLGRPFRGFIIGLYHNGRLHRFTTYNGAFIESLRIDELEVALTAHRGQRTLEVVAERTPGGRLRSPEGAEMQERVTESMRSTLWVKLAESRTTVYESTGTPAALEVTGDVSQYG